MHDGIGGAHLAFHLLRKRKREMTMEDIFKRIFALHIQKHEITPKLCCVVIGWLALKCLWLAHKFRHMCNTSSPKMVSF